MNSPHESGLVIFAASLVLTLCLPIPKNYVELISEDRVSAIPQESVDLVSGERVLAIAQDSVDLISGERVPAIPQDSIDLLSWVPVSEESINLVSADQIASTPARHKATPSTTTHSRQLPNRCSEEEGPWIT
jgi:hypothetical protein